MHHQFAKLARAHPAQLGRLVLRRGEPASNCAIEVNLYGAAADELRARGVNVIAVDTTSTPPETIAGQLAEHVWALVARRPIDPPPGT